MIRKSIFLMTLAVVMCFASCEKYDHAIADIEDRLDKIEGTSIKTIEQQIASINTSLTDLKSVDAALQTLIDDLEAEAANLQAELDANATADAATKKALEEKITALETLIATLQEKDTELDKKIADLETYVNDEITATEDWANTTFATLEQYEEVQTWIEAFKVAIDNLNKWTSETDLLLASKFADIEKAIADTETTMKAWVNEQLEQPLKDIAALQAALSALEGNTATDEELSTAIEAQQKKLEEAVDDLVAAYEKAIKKAIEDNNGVINDAISAAITVATNNLQSEIDSIKSEISSIKSRLDALENRIQSLTYIPTHTDGKATLTYNSTSDNWEASLSFFVTPKSVVGTIKQKHISAKGVYTATTRAVNLIDLSVTAFESDAANGTITVTVSGDNLTDFLNGTSDAAVFLIISDGNNEFVSDYVPLVLKNPDNINAANMSADDLKTTVSQALNGGVRDFTITGNLTEEQQKAVGSALRDWCGTKDSEGYNEAGQGTVSLTLPDVTEIFDNTFGEIGLDGDDGVTQQSYALKSVNLPKVSVIGDGAFSHQHYLQSVTAPNVIEVKGSGFGSCNALTQVNMPNVKKVGNFSFSHTSFADFPFSNLQEIGNYAFQNNSGELTSVTLSNATSIGNGAFRYGSKLERITAPQLTVIPLWAFSDCKNLTTLSLGSPITEWGNQVLNNVPTENITLYLHKDQKALSDDDSNAVWTIADGASGVEFGTSKTFCGYTFKEIKKYGE